MNKKIVKSLLIVISLLYIIIELIIEGFLNKIMNTAIEPYENITFILAIILLLIGIFMDNTNNKIGKSQEENNTIRKYKILKFIGFIPFILVILFGIFSMFAGFSFFSNESYGLSAFFGSIMVISLVLAWPFYIIGIILIIKSNKKLKQINESCDKHEI